MNAITYRLQPTGIVERLYTIETDNGHRRGAIQTNQGQHRARIERTGTTDVTGPWRGTAVQARADLRRLAHPPDDSPTERTTT